MSRVVLLTGWHLSQKALYYGKHLANGHKDSPSELVLVVDRQPAIKGFARTWRQNLSNLQLAKLLLAQDSELLLGLGPITEVLVVGRCRLHSAHDVLGVVEVGHIKTKVVEASAGDELIAVFLEAFRALQVDNCLDHVQSLFIEK